MILMLHPGDLLWWDWIRIGLIILALTALPIGIVGLLIYKVIKNHSSDTNDP